MKQTLCFACFGCAWYTRLWVISQGSDAGVFLELWLRMESNTGILRVVAQNSECFRMCSTSGGLEVEHQR